MFLDIDEHGKFLGKNKCKIVLGRELKRW